MHRLDDDDDTGRQSVFLEGCPDWRSRVASGARATCRGCSIQIPKIQSPPRLTSCHNPAFAMSSEADDGGLDLFQEPADFYEPEKQATFASHQLRSGKELTVRLVGHNPLWVRHCLAFYNPKQTTELVSPSKSAVRSLEITSHEMALRNF